ncbi:MAG: hypothetical protein Rubg2KO_10700 [Rubricoccaceae bacterium]
MAWIGALPFLIPIVAILAGTYAKVVKMKAEAQVELARATEHLEDELADAQDERDRLRTRIETLEAIVTSEGFDLDREARAAGLDLDALDEAPSTERARSSRRRTR